MLELRKGVDILSEVGGVRTIDKARSVLAASMDAATTAKISTITNADALIKIANMVVMCAPERVLVVGPSAGIRERTIDRNEKIESCNCLHRGVWGKSMLELRKGADILAEVGGVRTIDEARRVFA
ncbi:MAG TPA: hypothetical protein VMM82_03065, partial [Spirochaetia bacterium]|nr:hypothetical protein [Spirochaetia bacterium]